jgi:hypothetical protein
MLRPHHARDHHARDPIMRAIIRVSVMRVILTGLLGYDGKSVLPWLEPKLWISAGGPTR